ncbi:hypothetical protein C2L64_14160 [Paraburkholderia hospita]|uniref:Uncharacterized protein n=1 Tax=Paraburkholderia hospita TaxID=169430 RepID=A0AAN1JA80_9BURK|nr:hypothetical protein C2L64_14160 [Paraburkholderia hospita]
MEHLRFVFDEAWFIEQPLKAGPSNTSISVGNMQNISGQFDCDPSRLFQRRLADGHWQRAGRLRLVVDATAVAATADVPSVAPALGPS